MSRYLTTPEVAALLRVTRRAAWMTLRRRRIVPVGADVREGCAGRPCLVWRSEDVWPVVREYRDTLAVRKRRAAIIAGIRLRKAKREALANG